MFLKQKLTCQNIPTFADINTIIHSGSPTLITAFMVQGKESDGQRLQLHFPKCFSMSYFVLLPGTVVGYEAMRFMGPGQPGDP